MEYYIGALKKYAVFEGRATRSEYWYFFLFNLVISIIIGLLDVPALGFLYSLAVLIPSLAVGVRRLHDVGKSGWWLLIGLIPVVGWIVLIIFAVTDSQSGTNQYGPNLKETRVPEVSVPPVTPVV